MRTATAVLVVLLLPLLLLCSCVPERSSSHEVAADLKNYSTELRRWEPTEQQIFRSLDDVEQSQYVDDAFVVRTLKATLPTLDEHIREVAAYRPATSELSGLHDHYRKGWEDLRRAIDAMIAAASKKDYIALAKAKSQMVTARSTLLKAFASMDALMEENDQMQRGPRRS
jgi:hypothetical protein